jgi:hypothetical protein
MLFLQRSSSSSWNAGPHSSSVWDEKETGEPLSSELDNRFMKKAVCWGETFGLTGL